MRMPVFEFNDSVTATGVPASQTTAQLLVRPPRAMSFQVKGAGAAPTAWNVVLEASLDGANWTALLTHSNVATASYAASTDGQLLWSSVAGFGSGPTLAPANYYRTRVVSLTLGSATALNVLAQGV